MLRLLAFSLALILALSCLSGCEKPEVRAVRLADDQMDAAIEACDGKAAVQSLSKATIAWLDKLLDHARKSPAATVKSLPFSDRARVLNMRLRLSPEELRTFDGRRYFVHGVDKGWENSTSTDGITRGKITVLGDQARVEYSRDDLEFTIEGVFVLEDGEWKADYPLSTPGVDQAVKKLLRRAGMSENDLIFRNLERKSGRPVKDWIWDPIK